MTELIICVVIAVFMTAGLLVGAFAYGLKCGKAMQGDIPPMVEPKPSREEDVMGNPFD